VRQGPRAGLRTLADIEDRALRLVQALDDAQRAKAVISSEAPRDIRAANTPQPPTEAAEGIVASELKPDQFSMLMALVHAYAQDMPNAVAVTWLNEINRKGNQDVRFAWFGPADRTQPHAYRIQGPTFL